MTQEYTQVVGRVSREPGKFPAYFQIKRYYEHTTESYWWTLCVIHANEQLATLRSFCDREAMEWRTEPSNP